MTELSVTLGPGRWCDTAHLVLAAILDDAVRDRLLVANVARGVQEAEAGAARGTCT